MNKTKILHIIQGACWLSVGKYLKEPSNNVDGLLIFLFRKDNCPNLLNFSMMPSGNDNMLSSKYFPNNNT